MNLVMRMTQVTMIYDILDSWSCANSNTRIVSPISLKIILVEAHNYVSTMFFFVITTLSPGNCGDQWMVLSDEHEISVTLSCDSYRPSIGRLHHGA